MLTRVLLAIRHPKLRQRLRQILRPADALFDDACTDDELWERLPRENYDLVVVERALLADVSLGQLASLPGLPERPDVIVLSADADAADHAHLLAAGCVSVLAADLPNKALHDALTAVVNRRRARVEQQLDGHAVAERPRLAGLPSASVAMQAFLAIARRVVSSDTSLLITGETGVGKEWLARAIHADGPRAAGPFVAVNCGALPESLLESELFGHEEGAFTGASRARRGWFELAHRGTIFLDEIGDMRPHLQVKLLHVLQNREVQRVGAERSIGIDVRVMAATNRDLLAEVEAGNFRRDLYYRLGVVTLTIPPLRERPEDIPPLVRSYVQHFRRQIHPEVQGVDDQAMEALKHYDWPGNVRELINVIERAMLLSSGTRIGVPDLPEAIARSGASRGLPALSRNNSDELPADWLQRPLREVRREVLDQLERAYLQGLLQATRGRIGETARRAGLQPRSLFEKMRRLGLRKEDFR